MSSLLFDEIEYQFFQISFSLPQKEKVVILKEKNNIMSKFGNLKRIKSIPHITVCTIKVSKGKTESIKITQELQRISSFEVDLNIQTNNLGEKWRLVRKFSLSDGIN